MASHSRKEQKDKMKLGWEDQTIYQQGGKDKQSCCGVRQFVQTYCILSPQNFTDHIKKIDSFMKM